MIKEPSAKHNFVAKFAHFERKQRTRDEVVSEEDTARSDEPFAAEVCKLQQKEGFAEGSKVSYGDIWLVNYSPSIGHEYQKMRPAVVISPDTLLKRSSLFTCIAITSKTAKVMPDDIKLPKTAQNKLHQDSIIKMHHLTSYDKRRLGKYIGSVDNQTLETIKTKLKELYKLF